MICSSIRFQTQTAWAGLSAPPPCAEGDAALGEGAACRLLTTVEAELCVLASGVLANGVLARGIPTSADDASMRVGGSSGEEASEAASGRGRDDGGENGGGGDGDGGGGKA